MVRRGVEQISEDAGCGCDLSYNQWQHEDHSRAETSAATPTERRSKAANIQHVSVADDADHFVASECTVCCRHCLSSFFG